MIFNRVFEGNTLPENPKEHEATLEEVIEKLDERLEELSENVGIAERTFGDVVKALDRAFDSIAVRSTNPEKVMQQIVELKDRSKGLHEALQSLRVDRERTKVLIARIKEIKRKRDDALLRIDEERQN